MGEHVEGELKLGRNGPAEEFKPRDEFAGERAARRAASSASPTLGSPGPSGATCGGLMGEFLARLAIGITRRSQVRLVHYGECIGVRSSAHHRGTQAIGETRPF